jgi:phenylpropionate dioxygenase-like ring-hydroxylating dioxygenase large terminal subunit
MIHTTKRPIFFERELDSGPKSIKQGVSRYVVWRTGEGKYGCTPDVCTHRGAKLSTGRVVGGCIECPYHGWRFNAKGTCTRVPQKAPGAKLPKACNFPDVPQAVAKDGIVWFGSPEQSLSSVPEFYEDSSYIVTDCAFDANYSYALQVENLLDPAHINFVHDGFQGSRKGAGEIQVRNVVSSPTELSALFVHPNGSVPNVRIKLHIPYTVEVSVYDTPTQKKVVRKNVIYVTPVGEDSCRVLFRDVVVKKYAAPKEPIATGLLEFFSESQAFKDINESVVKSIMQQDIDVLEGQQENVDASFRYVLPTPSDKLIVLFRKWLKKNQSCLC